MGSPNKNRNKSTQSKNEEPKAITQPPTSKINENQFKELIDKLSKISENTETIKDNSKEIKNHTSRIKNNNDFFNLRFLKLFSIIMIGIVLLITVINKSIDKYSLTAVNGFVLFIKNLYYTLSDPLTIVFIPLAVLISLYRNSKNKKSKKNNKNKKR